VEIFVSTSISLLQSNEQAPFVTWFEARINQSSQSEFGRMRFALIKTPDVNDREEFCDALALDGELAALHRAYFRDGALKSRYAESGLPWVLYISSLALSSPSQDVRVPCSITRRLCEVFGRNCELCVARSMSEADVQLWTAIGFSASLHANGDFEYLHLPLALLQPHIVGTRQSA
jgi:hypothetical protein